MNNSFIQRISQLVGSTPTELPAGIHSIQFPQQTIEFQLKYQKRKTLTLEIQHSKVVVKAPFATPKHWIETFLQQKQQWILVKLAKQSSQIQGQIHYQDGDKLLLFGEWLLLSVTTGKKFSQTLDLSEKVLHFQIPNTLKNPTDYIKKKLRAFYHSQAQQYIESRFAELQQQTQLKANQLSFKIYKRRWGCCYQSGDIIINPMIMAAPKSYIDCVLIHELCHLKHMNHSRQFWLLNKEYCDHCAATRSWLELYQHAIFLP